MTGDELDGAELAITAMVVTISGFVAKNPAVPVTNEVIQEAIGVAMLKLEEAGLKRRASEVAHEILEYMTFTDFSRLSAIIAPTLAIGSVQ
jgi:hypothetical protein